jgi:predicted metal-dependent enzyme (double-stranded beta helix superfamily)
MSETRLFGDIATKLLMENDRVRIWEMRLEPGQKSDLHKHETDYIMIQIAGDKMAADFEADSGGSWPEAAGARIEGDIAPGNVLFAERGGIETAINTGSETFFEIVVELKD